MKIIIAGDTTNETTPNYAMQAFLVNNYCCHMIEGSLIATIKPNISRKSKITNVTNFLWK